jgi:hypothetical protein
VRFKIRNLENKFMEELPMDNIRIKSKLDLIRSDIEAMDTSWHLELVELLELILIKKDAIMDGNCTTHIELIKDGVYLTSINYYQMNPPIPKVGDEVSMKLMHTAMSESYKVKNVEYVYGVERLSNDAVREYVVVYIHVGLPIRNKRA